MASADCGLCCCGCGCDEAPAGGPASAATGTVAPCWNRNAEPAGSLPVGERSGDTEIDADGACLPFGVGCALITRFVGAGDSCKDDGDEEEAAAVAGPAGGDRFGVCVCACELCRGGDPLFASAATACADATSAATACAAVLGERGVLALELPGEFVPF